MKNMVLKLKPLSCPSCAKKIENMLQREEGVRAAKVLYNTGRVKVSYDEERTEPIRIASRLKDAGYGVESMRQCIS